MYKKTSKYSGGGEAKKPKGYAMGGAPKKPKKPKGYALGGAANIRRARQGAEVNR
tara:strand:- start:434 stop:598 length:165 start_codon:yes stop_codon:yes gene_type:complete